LLLLLYIFLFSYREISAAAATTTTAEDDGTHHRNTGDATPAHVNRTD